MDLGDRVSSLYGAGIVPSLWLMGTATDEYSTTGAGDENQKCLCRPYARPRGGEGAAPQYRSPLLRIEGIIRVQSVR